MGKYLITFAVAYSLALQLSGQNICSEFLSEAQDSFEDGRFYGIPSLLKPCLDNGFTKEQKIQAYWILTQTYLLIDDPIGAEDSYLKLLHEDPEYKVDPVSDPIDVLYLSEKFITTPIFSFGVKAGLNFSDVSVINNYGVGNTEEIGLDKYTPKVGFQLGGVGKFNFNPNFSLGLEVIYSFKSFLYESVLFDDPNVRFDEDLLESVETQNWIDVPIYLKYSLVKKRWQPNVYAGVALNFLFDAEAKITLLNRQVDDENNVSELPVSGPNIGFNEQRNFVNASLVLGGGVNYKINLNYIFFDVRYMAGINNLLNIENQYRQVGEDYSFETYARYGYVDDDFRLNNVAFSIGFIKPIYKPRKVKPKGSTFLDNLLKRKKVKDE